MSFVPLPVCKWDAGLKITKTELEPFQDPKKLHNL